MHTNSWSITLRINEFVCLCALIPVKSNVDINEVLFNMSSVITYY